MMQRMNIVTGLVLLMSSGFAGQLRAEEDAADLKYAAQKGTGLSLLLGIDAGLAVSEPDNPEKESAKQGLHLAGKAIFSLYTDKAALDLGVGWFDNRLEGDAVDKVEGQDEDQSRIRTRAGYAEFAARYRSSERFEWGPVAQMAFGVDSTFSPFPNEPKTPNVFAGLQAVYAYRTGADFDNRFTLALTTDVTIKARQMVFLTLGFAIGVPLVERDVVVERLVEVVEREKYVVGSEFINFETDKDELSADSRKFLAVLGRYLARHPEIWEQLVISGHADMRGSDEYNLELSRRRAETVKAVLVEGGVNEDQIELRTFGFRAPVDPRSANESLARNRRVEISFEGRTDTGHIRDLLSKLRQLFATPPTCEGEDCL